MKEAGIEHGHAEVRYILPVVKIIRCHPLLMVATLIVLAVVGWWMWAVSALKGLSSYDFYSFT